MKIVDALTMRGVDDQARSSYHIPALLLMERAGEGVISCLQKIPELDDRLQDACWVFLAGAGNNGGDALVAAREVFNTYENCTGLTCLISGDKGSESFMTQLDICRSLGMVIRYWDDPEVLRIIAGATIIIDGITGNGLRTPLRPEAAALVRYTSKELRREGAVLISIDLPSGLYEGAGPDDPIIEADVTVVMGLPLRTLFEPMHRPKVGSLNIVNPGFPNEILRRTPAIAELIDREIPHLPSIPASSYKNSRAHAALFCGSVAFTGAARLSAGAALRSRVGLATLFVDSTIHEVISRKARSLIVALVEPDTVITAGRLAETYDSLLMGPGWGRDPVLELQLSQGIVSGLPMIIDADGLHILKRLMDGERILDSRTRGTILLTPHPGEWRALIKGTAAEDEGSVFDQLAVFSEEFGVTILYKSHVMVIVSPGSCPKIIDGMNPALGTAGSGDVLAGILVGMLAQGLSVPEAALTGACVLQRIGAEVFRKRGWFASEDLIPYIGRLL